MSEQCNSCSSKDGCSSSPEQCGAEQEKSLLGANNNIKNVIVVMSGKGGVGKSSVTAMLASKLARAGKKVGVLDADITGPSQPRAFGIKGGNIQSTEYGLVPPVSKLGIKVMSINFFLPNEDDPVIWRGPLLAGAVSQFWNEVNWGELDYMVVDLPPGTGDVPLTVMQSLPVTGIVIVSSPQDLAFMVVKKTIKMAQKMNVPIVGLIENMSYALCPHCNEKLEIFGKSQGAEVAKNTGIEFLGGLHWDAELTGLVDNGKVEQYESAEVNAVVDKLMQALA